MKIGVSSDHSDGLNTLIYQIRRSTQKEFIVPHIFFPIGNKE